jgi:hypothetical protein
MNGFAADPGELRDGAGTLAKILDDLAEPNAMGWSMDPKEAGHDALAAELTTFQAQLTATMAILRHDIQETSDGLRDNAHKYEMLDLPPTGECP